MTKYEPNIKASGSIYWISLAKRSRLQSSLNGRENKEKKSLSRDGDKVPIENRR